MFLELGRKKETVYVQSDDILCLFCVIMIIVFLS